MARLTAAAERPSRRPAPARLPSSSAATNTLIASIRSIPRLSRSRTPDASIGHPAGFANVNQACRAAAGVERSLAKLDLAAEHRDAAAAHGRPDAIHGPPRG